MYDGPRFKFEGMYVFLFVIFMMIIVYGF